MCTERGNSLRSSSPRSGYSWMLRTEEAVSMLGESMVFRETAWNAQPFAVKSIPLVHKNLFNCEQT